MILNKRIAVMLNLVHFKFKRNVAITFEKYGFDITPEQFLILDSLWDDNKGLSQQQIACIVMKDKNSVSKLIDGLEKKGLIVRIPDKADRRQNIVKVTDKALKISEEIQEVAMLAVDNIISGIDEKDMDTFINVLSLISENMDRLAEEQKEENDILSE